MTLYWACASGTVAASADSASRCEAVIERRDVGVGVDMGEGESGRTVESTRAPRGHQWPLATRVQTSQRVTSSMHERSAPSRARVALGRLDGIGEEQDRKSTR